VDNLKAVAAAGAVIDAGMEAAPVERICLGIDGGGYSFACFVLFVVRRREIAALRS
jgi:hypothetical protein